MLGTSRELRMCRMVYDGCVLVSDCEGVRLQLKHSNLKRIRTSDVSDVVDLERRSCAFTKKSVLH